MLTFDRRWVDQGRVLWSFCVDYFDQAAGGGPSVTQGPAQRGKVDYRDKLAHPGF